MTAQKLVGQARPFALGIGFFLLLLLPGVLIGNYLIQGAASVFLFGAIPVASAYFGGARNRSALIIAFMAVVGTLARVFEQAPLPSAVLVAVVGLVIGFTARRGLASPILSVGIVIGFLVVSPPDLTPKVSGAFSSVNPIAATLILLILGGLWALGVGLAVHKKAPRVPESESGNLSVLVPYALALAISAGVSTYVLLIYMPNGVGAWLILTIFVVLQPDQGASIARTRDRIRGTLAGAVVAFFALELLQFFDWQQGLIQVTAALLFIGIAMAYYAPGPYWKYVFFLTPGVVLLDSNSVSDQANIDLLRVFFTLIGAALALTVAFLIREGTNIVLARKSTTPGQ